MNKLSPLTDISVLNQLIQDIKRKKEYYSLSEEFINKQLREVLKKNPSLVRKLQYLTSRSTVYKTIIKLVRNDLRKLYGLFRSKQQRLQSLLEEFSNSPNRPVNLKLLKLILQQHASTKERLTYYPELYSQLFALTGQPKIILDLGCGLNPFSLNYMNLPTVTYYAYDLHELEIAAINSFFEIKLLKGRAEVKDVLTLQSMPAADVAFLFKMTDMLDKGHGHKGTEEMLTRIPARYVIISFATLTISRQPMKAPQRRWMEWLCRRLSYSYQLVEIPNELFYVIKKSS